MRNVVISIAAVLVMAAPAARAGWSYSYSDDFSTQKAMADSYSHSNLWPGGIVPPPPEPYLFYTSDVVPPVNPPGALGFSTGGGELYYSFPVPSDPGAPAQLTGSLTLNIYDLGAGYAYFSKSPDGTNWILPMPLGFGQRSIPLGSSWGTCYVVIGGYDIAIDDLQAELVPEPATLSLLGIGAVGLLRRKLQTRAWKNTSASKRL